MKVGGRMLAASRRAASVPRERKAQGRSGMVTRGRGVRLLAGGLAATAAAAGAKEGAGSTLPLKSVVLFSSGVGYFQRTGEITGPATIPLSFRSEQVDDILKSLVLFDPQGQVLPVTYS